MCPLSSRTPTTPSKKRPGGWKYDRCAWPDPANRSGQHPLLSKAARNIKPQLLWNLSEDEAYATFGAFRWSENGGKPRCPACGCRKAYVMGRRRFRCSNANCVREFSVTSGTLFHSRKLPFKTLIMAMWEELTAVKGLAALHLTRKLSVQYKTAWVLLAKIREAIGLRRAKMWLWGSVQIDGKYVGGHITPENKKSERIDRRKKENQNGKRVCVMALRENNRHGPNRTFSRVVLDENSNAARVAVRDHVERGTRMIADEHPSYDDLRGLAELDRVNHSEAYETDEGVNTNAAESFFARVERSYVGIHHRFSGKYLDWYMAMVAWKTDTHYMGLHWQLADILRTVTHRATSANLCGYWQRAAARIADQVWTPETEAVTPRYLR